MNSAGEDDAARFGPSVGGEPVLCIKAIASQPFYLRTMKPGTSAA
jgi:hypothetical protein